MSRQLDHRSGGRWNQNFKYLWLVIYTLDFTRPEIEAAFKTLDLIPKRAGIKPLDRSNRETAESLLSGLAEYGVFVVPVGELALWLPHLGVPSQSQKREWLPAVFEKMGNDPDTAEYLRPGNDDVWTFVEQIARWIADPARKGMPP